MAFNLLSHEVSDLTIGKPAVSCMSSSCSVRDALLALKKQLRTTGPTHRQWADISVWDCKCGNADAVSSFQHERESCRCIGLISIHRIESYLATAESRGNPYKALEVPLSVLVLPHQRKIQHVEPRANLMEALSAIAKGAQILVVPIPRSPVCIDRCNQGLQPTPQQKSSGLLNSPDLVWNRHIDERAYCRLTQEDVLRFLVGYVSHWWPLPTISIQELGLISTVRTDEQVVLSTVNEVPQAVMGGEMVSAAVVETDVGGKGKLVEEISTSTLQTRKSKTFTAHLDPARSVLLSEARLLSDDDDDDMMWRIEDVESPRGPHDLLRPITASWWVSSGDDGCAAAASPLLCCRPRSSLIAVIMQALAHRQQHVWVTHEEDHRLVGIVTFSQIIALLYDHLSHTASSN